MIAERKRKPHQDDNDRDERERRHQEKALDEALKNTFPASDPVSIEQSVPPAADRDEGGASSAGDRSVRKHSSGIEQPVKSAVAPTHTEDLQSNSDVPRKGRLAVRGGVLRKKGR